MILRLRNRATLLCSLAAGAPAAAAMTSLATGIANKVRKVFFFQRSQPHINILENQKKMRHTDTAYSSRAGVVELGGPLGKAEPVLWLQDRQDFAWFLSVV